MTEKICKPILTNADEAHIDLYHHIEELSYKKGELTCLRKLMLNIYPTIRLQ